MDMQSGNENKFMELNDKIKDNSKIGEILENEIEIIKHDYKN